MRWTLLVVLALTAACGDDDSGEPVSEALLVCADGMREQRFDRPENAGAAEDLRVAADVRWCETEAGAAHGPYLERGSDGLTLAEGTFVDGRADGVWTWYVAGTSVRRKVISLRSGVAHGAASAWDDAGAPRWERHYEDGGACGIWRTWDGEDIALQDFGACDDGEPWTPQVVRDAPSDVARAWTGACPGRLVRGTGVDADAAWCEIEVAGAWTRDGPFARFWDGDETRPKEDGQYTIGRATGTWHLFATSGEVVARALYDDGDKDGEETLWRTDGSTLEVRTWVGGVAEGVWETFYPSGPKASETRWSDGVKDGREVVLALDGTTRRETTWRAGVKDGIERDYYEAIDGDGSARSETVYVSGVRDGTATSWHPNGGKAEERVYDDDVWTAWKTWDHDGLPESESALVGGVLHGPGSIWLTDPVLGLRVKDSGVYVDGLAEGPWRGVYEATGTPWRERRVYRGVSEGPFVQWWPDGSKQAEGELAWGYLEHVYRVWWDNENPALACGYHRGLRDGPCTEWWENGQMKARGEYVEGHKRDGWEYWDEQGHPMSAPAEDGS